MDVYVPQPGDLERKLLALYPDDGRREEARGILARSGAEPWHRGDDRGKDRVRLAALFVAGSDLSKLDEVIELANVDYRDVLVAAEYPRSARFPPGTDRTSPEYRAAVEADSAAYRSWVAE